ncbi:hypothetical protein SISSUDRAFT_1051964 [Sistotremastrum suecicum HHB10207 ss-3]|uniref:Palmitoyltransferase n=1 Tax=Sistotremastrum suecicum HHB10207 ss-3 TaxID=1314776 RepID=A0A166A8K0_9AGAM|nr:hypothetical protein SISSUDRAFT_1051964 [Sistotremastrum suecicum HHB10207 ss-3]
MNPPSPDNTSFDHSAGDTTADTSADRSSTAHLLTASTYRARSGSVASSRSRGTRSGSVAYPPLPFGPQPYNISFQSTGAAQNAPPHVSSTHAEGIQPPASFFRPSRPNNNYIPSLPSSPPRPSEFHSSSLTLPTEIENPNLPFAGSPFVKQLTHHGNFSAGAVGVGRGETTKEPILDDPAYTLRRPEKLQLNREPLLPISGSGGLWKPAAPSSPQVTRTRSPTQTHSPTGSRVRLSLEKIFKRTVSPEQSVISLPRKSSDRRKSLATSVRDDAHLPSNGQNRVHSSDIRASQDYFSSLANRKPSPPSSISTAHTTSRHPPFYPNPPGTKPPARIPFKPALAPGRKRPLKNYVGYPSQNKFFFGGRLLTGGDSIIPFLCTLLVVFGVTGVWFGTTCVWWWHNKSPAVAGAGAYLALITISNLFAAAFRDPGILPRDMDPDPPYPATSPSDGGTRVPLPRDLKIRDGYVRVKYCTTCETYRPPRSSHCRMCDNCVDGCDHHCQWLNNCVGRRNYTSFIVLLLSAALTLVMVIITSALHIHFLVSDDGFDFDQALRHGAGSAVGFCLGIVVIWPVLALMSYHVRLLLFNITTIEQVRNQAHKKLVPGPPPPNPFTLGRWYRNLAYLLCRPSGYTWIEADGVKLIDQREFGPWAWRNGNANARNEGVWEHERHG